MHFADSNSTFFGARSSLAIRKPRILLSTGSAITSGLPTIRELACGCSNPDDARTPSEYSYGNRELCCVCYGQSPLERPEV